MSEQEYKRYIVEDVLDGKRGKYKKTDTEFTYYTKKQYKAYIEELLQNVDNTGICTEDQPGDIGHIRLKPCDLQKIDDTRNVNGNTVTSSEVVEQQVYDTVIFEKELPDAAAYTRRNVKVVGLETEFLEKAPIFTYCKGYIAVGKNKFVQWRKSLIPVLLLLFGILFCSFGGYTIYHEITTIDKDNYEENNPDYDETQKTWDGDLPKSGKNSIAAQDTTTFPGYSTIVVSAENDTVELINPTENTVDFRYTLCDAEGNVLYTTSKIRPGKYIDFSIGKLFTSVGNYTLSFVIKTYDVTSGVECTSVTIPVVLVVE